MDLAIKMSDERTLGVDPQQDRLKDASADINNGRGRDLLQLMNKVRSVCLLSFIHKHLTSTNALSFFYHTYASS